MTQHRYVKVSELVARLHLAADDLRRFEAEGLVHVKYSSEGEPVLSADDVERVRLAHASHDRTGGEPGRCRGHRAHARVHAGDATPVCGRSRRRGGRIAAPGEALGAPRPCWPVGKRVPFRVPRAAGTPCQTTSPRTTRSSTPRPSRRLRRPTSRQSRSRPMPRIATRPTRTTTDRRARSSPTIRCSATWPRFAATRCCRARKSTTSRCGTRNTRTSMRPTGW